MARWWIVGFVGLAACGPVQWGVTARGVERIRSGYPVQDFADDCFLAVSRAEVVFTEPEVFTENGRGWTAWVAQAYQTYDTGGSANTDVVYLLEGYTDVAINLDAEDPVGAFAAEVPSKPLSELQFTIRPSSSAYFDGDFASEITSGESGLVVDASAQCRADRVDFHLELPVRQRWSCPLGGVVGGSVEEPTLSRMTMDLAPLFRSSQDDAAAPLRLRAWVDADTNASGSLSVEELADGWLDPELYDLGGQELRLGAWVEALSRRTGPSVDGRPCVPVEGEGS